MLGDRLHPAIDGHGQVADRQLAGAQRLDDAPTRGLAEDLAELVQRTFGFGLSDSLASRPDPVGFMDDHRLTSCDVHRDANRKSCAERRSGSVKPSVPSAPSNRGRPH